MEISRPPLIPLKIPSISWNQHCLWAFCSQSDSWLPFINDLLFLKILIFFLFHSFHYTVTSCKTHPPIFFLFFESFQSKVVHLFLNLGLLSYYFIRYSLSSCLLPRRQASCYTAVVTLPVLSSACYVSSHAPSFCPSLLSSRRVS